MNTFKIRTLAIVFIVAIGMSGCASTKGYFADRVQDAGDIFTATVGVGAGATAKVGPLNVGLLANHDIAGLRSGIVFHNPDTAVQYDLLLMGQTQFQTSVNSLGRNKCINDFKIFGIGIPAWEGTCLRKESLFQIELVAGAGPSVRLGFNPSEVIDFTLGWIGIDIFGDDSMNNSI